MSDLKNFAPKYSRRRLLKSTALGALTAGETLGGMLSKTLGDVSIGGVLESFAANMTGKKLHGMSSFGDLKYSADFSNFSYASLDAPKGGLFSFSPSNWVYNQNSQTFNTLNSFVLKGSSPPRMDLCFDTLMVRAIDEPDAVYCSCAKSVEISADRNRYIFEIRDEARFHDGSKLTAEDVAFSYDLIKQKGHPQLANDLRDLEEIRVAKGNRVELIFNGKQSDQVILTISSLMPIFSKAYYSEHEFDSSNLDIPLASGPWQVGKFSAGQYIEYERVKNYWAKDLPFARGLDHFDKLRIDFYAERIAAFEAFKKGDVLWREEFTSKVWATQYDFPAIKNGKVVKKLFKGELVPSLQGWALNTRRSKFADIKVRQALSLCFDFEWTNKNLFYGAYSRSQSLFEKSSFKAQGKPGPEELALLQSLKGELPQSVFEDAVMQPTSNGSGNDRDNLKNAFRLFQQAGFQSKDGKLVDSDGQQIRIEFLLNSKAFEKVLGGFISNLRQLGIAGEIRLVDPSQYQSRVEEFNFDIIVAAFLFTSSPTAEAMRNFFHSKSSRRKGSYNMSGIQDPAVDELIEVLATVKTRNELTIVMQSLDRVLRAHQFWIPNWFSANHRVAMWDRFGWNDPKPDYEFPVERLWWYDPAKDANINKG